MKFKFLILVLTMIWSPGILFGQTSGNADLLFEQQNYEAAIEAYKQGLKTNSEGFEASALKIAETYRAMDDAPNAVQWFGKVLKTGKESFDSRYFLHYAQMLSFVGEHNDARYWYDLFANESNSMFGSRDQVFDTYEYNDTIRLEIFNLNINTINDEFAATFYGDSIAFVGGLPFRQTKYYQEDISSDKYYDLYHSSSVGDQLYSKPQKFSPKINSQLNEGPMVFAGDKMYFTRNLYKSAEEIKKKDTDVRLRIFESEINSGDKGKAKELPFSGDYSVGHPAISPDGSKFYFASDMPGGYGGSDLYVCERQGNGWGSPQNLGPAINTDGNELFPFAHTGGILFFASNEHNGIGGLDIFKVNLNGRQQVINLEEPINSSRDDFAFVINEDENRGFFSSNREEGKGGDDIYGFIGAGVAVNIQVLDFQTGEPIPEANISVSDIYGLFMHSETNTNGEARFQARTKRIYDVFVQANGFQSKSDRIDIEQSGGDDIVYSIIWLDRLGTNSPGSRPSDLPFDRSNNSPTNDRSNDRSNVEQERTTSPSRSGSIDAYVDPYKDQKDSSLSNNEKKPEVTRKEPEPSRDIITEKPMPIQRNSSGFDLLEIINQNGNHQYFVCSKTDFYQMVSVKGRSYLLSGRNRIALTAPAGLSQRQILEQNGYPIDNVTAITDLSFAQSSGELTANAKQELNKVVAIMKKQPGLIVSLKGFGSEGTSSKLAQKRVDLACKYLMSRGIAQKRVFPALLGNECRSNCGNDPALNRKVEISLTKSFISDTL